MAQANNDKPNDSTNSSNTQDSQTATLPGGTPDMTPSTPLAQANPDQAANNKKIAEARAKELDARPDLDADEKEILKLYDKGVHMFGIAKQVFKFANSDTVGKVLLTIRKEHADDWQDIENINSTKGYAGIGIGSA